MQLRVQPNEIINRAQRLALQARDVSVESGPAFVAHQAGGEFFSQLWWIGERESLGVILDEEIERVDDRHVGDEIDLDFKFGRFLGEYETRQPIAVRVLLPVHEMIGGRDFQAVARNARAAMGRRA